MSLNGTHIVRLPLAFTEWHSSGYSKIQIIQCQIDSLKRVPDCILWNRSAFRERLDRPLSQHFLVELTSEQLRLRKFYWLLQKRKSLVETVKTENKLRETTLVKNLFENVLKKTQSFSRLCGA